jgi:Glycosyl transferase family 2
MKLIVFVLVHNNADVLPWFLRHYGVFADEISAFDDHSTDGTRELLAAHPKVILRDWPHEPGINEDIFLAHWQEWYPKARGRFDWVMIVDSDEFIWARNIRQILAVAENVGAEVIRTEGFNMVGDGLPKDDGRSQIYELNPMGVRAPVYSKPVVFRPHIKINWNRGKHALENCNPRMTPHAPLKLLHYRYLGADYTRAKNAKNYARCGLLSGDKGAAWSCSPGYDGPDKEHSPQWAEAAKKHAVNVLEL